MGTENSQLPHWLIVSVEEDDHGNQGIIAVGLAESMEVCNEARPLQEGLKEKKWAGMRDTAGTPLSPPTKSAYKAFLRMLTWALYSIRTVPSIYSVLSMFP